jgi:hypothetical protein
MRESNGEKRGNEGEKRSINGWFMANNSSLKRSRTAGAIAASA